MSDFLHYEIGYQPTGAVVEVELSVRANVLLLDSNNFSKYRRSQQYQYFGGEAIQSPYRLSVPHTGTWHVVLDLGGAAGRLRASVRVLAMAA